MSGDHCGCPVPGEGGVRAGAGGQLGVMLCGGARGLHADEAAAELLVAHGHWTGHGEFVRRFTWVQACPDPGGAPVAGVDWQGAVGGLGAGGGLACSASEAGVLRIAASLGGGVPVSLRAVLGGLDHVNIALAARAVLRANGTTSATVTVPAPPRFPPGVKVAGAGDAWPGQGR